MKGAGGETIKGAKMLKPTLESSRESSNSVKSREGNAPQAARLSVSDGATVLCPHVRPARDVNSVQSPTRLRARLPEEEVSAALFTFSFKLLPRCPAGIATGSQRCVDEPTLRAALQVRFKDAALARGHTFPPQRLTAFPKGLQSLVRAETCV